ncbi:hypothetical protein OFO01_07185 [Campylobacter sp. JMF_01 NE2]|nr:MULTISPECIES: hypothetical protein [unclassified Campylobacter]MDA3053253.1 hypothetical protein [Campylobacter sp. JMF_03 NE3]MDA3067564.1 hypothetical protein [Campylobacter sp. JMF_01 NE2]
MENELIDFIIILLPLCVAFVSFWIAYEIACFIAKFLGIDLAKKLEKFSL